ncbi:MAG: hypothetical protein KGI06_02850 [Candidatus Micrarchaeota archaeon]|nr:hypothetical protein [Candidatus Micrarchaeota archaeon]
MALDKLQKEIEEQAKSEAGRIADEGDAECAHIIEKAESDAKSLSDGIMDNARGESEQRRKDTSISLDIEIGSILTGAREERISRELKRFLPVLEARMRKSEGNLIKSALKRFSDVVPPELCTAKVDRRNEEIVKPYGMDVDHESIDGIIIESKDKRIRVDATISGTIGSNAETIRRVLSKGMFG